jgi:hypothetical protein
MKISKLHIDQFRHLENLDFDFTYQSGERKGQPLDKICFIGQSATGKTGLLELIYVYNILATNTTITNSNSFENSTFLRNVQGEISFIYGNEIYTQKNGEIYFKNKIYEDTRLGGTPRDIIPIQDKKDIFYFKANLISEKNTAFFDTNPLDILEKHNEKLPGIIIHFDSRIQYNNYYSYLFDDNVKPEIWLYLLNDILLYRKNFTQIMTELVHKGYINNAERFRSEYEKWQKENPNALESFAKEFNPLLEKLNLEVDLVNTEFSIPIKNKRTDEIIPIQDTSTGTKGLLLSFLPLFKLDTKDSIILIDEPERSLYPDMQMNLMDHYQRLAPDAQFIVATHSPFIAASFEPDERFILYFDEKGKVAVRRGTSPIGDDPNDMLKNDFDVNYYNKHGEEAYQKYIHLKQEVANETDPKRKKELLLETVKLGDTYNF